MHLVGYSHVSALEYFTKALYWKIYRMPVLNAAVYFNAEYEYRRQCKYRHKSCLLSHHKATGRGPLMDPWSASESEWMKRLSSREKVCTFGHLSHLLGYNQLVLVGGRGEGEIETATRMRTVRNYKETQTHLSLCFLVIHSECFLLELPSTCRKENTTGLVK